jgi:endonuclease/exonuclease/phosphatase family metal-dependent hydrolase
MALEYTHLSPLKIQKHNSRSYLIEFNHHLLALDDLTVSGELGVSASLEKSDSSSFSRGVDAIIAPDRLDKQITSEHHNYTTALVSTLTNSTETVSACGSGQSHVETVDKLNWPDELLGPEDDEKSLKYKKMYLNQCANNRSAETTVNSGSLGLRSGPIEVPHGDNLSTMLVNGGVDGSSERTQVSRVAMQNGGLENSKTLRLITLNCKNIKANYTYINDLLDDRADILFLQETWLRKDERVENILRASDQKNHKFRVFQHSSMAETYTRGRPYGGVMWVVSDRVRSPKVKFITDRISTVEYANTVIVGVYMRFNDNKPETVIEQLQDLAEVEELIERAEGKKVVVIGDFNMDLTRKNKLDKLLVKFVEKNNLICADLLYGQMPLGGQQTNYTYRSGNSHSWIDHVLVNSLLAREMCQVNIYSADSCNTSDHMAVGAEFYENHNRNTSNLKKQKQIKLNWEKKTTSDEYEKNLNSLLKNLDLSRLQAANEKNVVMALDEFVNEINSMARAAVEKTKASCAKNVHIKKKKWWDSEMTYIKEQVSMAYINYKNSNFMSIELRKNLTLLRAHFRYKQREKIRMNKKSYQRKLEILLRQNKSEFWKDLKKKKTKPPEISIKTEKLKESFEDLFNKKLVDNENNKEKLEEKKKEIDRYLTQITNSKYEVNKTTLESIIKSLKNNKSVGFGEVSNEMYKYGGETMLFCVKLIMEKIFEFGKMPHFFNIGKIIPIIKDEKGETDDMNNIRPITISDTLSNIFEKIVISEIESRNLDKDLQFGFKRNSSTNHAIFVLKETVNFYNSVKKNVYACAIDASKAFDKLNRIIMSHGLIGKINPLVWRALVNYYAVSVAYVHNKNETSTMFKTTIGVKQGGPLSPRLFALYVEDLIEELETSVFGTKIGSVKTGVLMFADDLIIISESKKNLENMLKIIEKFCLKNEIKINAKKTQYIRFGNYECQNEDEYVHLDGQLIKRVDKIEYLGVWLDSQLKSHTQIEEKKVSITNAFNAMRKIGIAERETSVNMKTFLYKVYCRPILYYGIENLTLNKKDVQTIQSIEATLIKYSYNLSKTTRTTNLLNAVEIEQSNNRIKVTKLKFFIRLMKNEITRRIIDVIVKKYQLTREKKTIKNSLLKDVLESVEESVLTDTACCKKIREIIKEIKKKEVSERNDGISDSIRICLENRNEFNDKLLKLLVQSFETIKPTLTLNSNTLVQEI